MCYTERDRNLGWDANLFLEPAAAAAAQNRVDRDTMSRN